MEAVTGWLATFWWVVVVGLLVIAMLFYKLVLRLAFGMVLIPEDAIGIVTKKFVLFGEHKTLPDPRFGHRETSRSKIRVDFYNPGSILQ